MTPLHIDLSCDLGEAVTPAEIAIEEMIWPLISSANIACGGHVGDAETMERSVALAMRYGVAIGAHPSYPDRENFGRRSMKIDDAALVESIVNQLTSIARVAAAAGSNLRIVKPHGALYNDAHANSHVAGLICSAMERLTLRPALVCSPHSVLRREAAGRGIGVILEGFGDRRYQSDGSLSPRGTPGALLLDVETAADQALRLATGRKVEAADGTLVYIDAQTICIHSDMERAAERLARIRQRLEEAGFAIRAVEEAGA